jgi:transcriptional regulator
MSTDLKYEKINIELRRGKVLELLARGHSQSDIAKKLNVSNALISLDVQFLKEQAQRELRVHIKEVIPFEYARAVSGINDILRRAYKILDRMTDPKMQLQTMTLLMQCYGNIMSLATDGGIVQEAMKMVKGLESQDTSEVKMSSDKDEDEDEEDFEDEEITVENDEEIINEEEQELREE